MNNKIWKKEESVTILTNLGTQRRFSVKVVYSVVFRIACLRPVHVRKLAFSIMLLIALKDSILSRFEQEIFNDTATTEIYTILFVGSVRCV